MFSSNDFIHLVFSKENDTYYCDDLLKLDLNQYLWMELHNSQYDTVYFLSETPRGFSISTYGDKGKLLATSFFGENLSNPTVKKFKSLLTGWIKSRSAIVCSLQDFCEVLKRADWKIILEMLCEQPKKRKGIIVLLVTPNSEHYLRENLFLKIYDRAELYQLISRSEREEGLSLREGLRNSRCENCVYLDDFTEDEIRNILIHVMIEDPEKLSDYKYIDLIAGYLIMSLDKGSALGDALGLKGKVSSRQQLYLFLCSIDNWRSLVTQSKKSDLRERLCKLKLPEQFQERSLHANRTEELLYDIQALLQRTTNAKPNYKIKSWACRFLYSLEEQQNYGDWATYKRLLFAIQFCLQWLYVTAESRDEAGILKIIEKLDTYIELSAQYFRLNRTLETNQNQVTNSSLTERVMKKLISSIDTVQRLLGRYEDLVIASIMGLSVSASTPSVTKWAEYLDEELSVLPQNMSAEENSTDEVDDDLGEEEQMEPEDDDLYIIRPSDYGYVPPSS